MSIMKQKADLQSGKIKAIMLFKIVIKLKIPFQNDKTITEEKND